MGPLHSQSFEGWFASVPGLKVVVPSTPYDALGLLRAAREENSPVVYAEHALLYGVRGEVPDEWYDVPLGKAAVRRAGTDVTIVAYSRMAHVALQAAEILSSSKSVEAEVIDLRTLRPLDMATVIDSVKKTNRAVVVEEAWRTGGFSAEVASSIQEEAFDYLDGPVQRVWRDGHSYPLFGQPGIGHHAQRRAHNAGNRRGIWHLVPGCADQHSRYVPPTRCPDMR